MSKFLIALFCSVISFGCQTTATKSEKSYQVINLEKEFASFWSQARTKNFEERLQLWDLIIEKNHQDLYDSLVWGKKSRPDWEKRKREKLQTYFKVYESKSDKILSDFREFDSLLTRQIEKYQKTFPDAHFALPIYVIPSGGSFNGKAGDLSKEPGKTVLAFGIDMIIERKDDPDVLYSHELFHVYHVALLGLNEEKAIQAKMTLPLWLEGFATYLSGQMNPQATEAQIFLDEDLLRARKDVPWLANAFLKSADQKAWDDRNHATYQAWFGMDRHRPRKDLPMRTGYLLGYEVARHLAQKYSLNEMVHWNLQESHEKVIQALNDLQN